MTVISAHNAFSHNKCTSNVQQSCEAGVADVTNDEMKTLKGQCLAQGHTAGVEKQTNKKTELEATSYDPILSVFLCITNLLLLTTI